MIFSLPDLIDVVYKYNRNSTPKLIFIDKMSRLRIRKYRDPQNNETATLLGSLKALLAHNYQLKSPHEQLASGWVVGSIGEHGVLLSGSLDEDAYYMNGLDITGLDSKELMPVWNDNPCLPVLIHTGHTGDQQVFIYITEHDEQGGYPATRFEGEGDDLWLTESLLIECLQGIFTGSEESRDEWQHQQTLSEACDGASLELEYTHEDLCTGLEGCSD